MEVFQKKINDAKLFTVDEFRAKELHHFVGRVNRKMDTNQYLTKILKLWPLN